MYECKVLADSVAPCGKRLTTVEVTYPRFVHAEILTHRMLSRNSASSRAIPNEKLRQRIIDDPAMPVWWGKNQSGMQAREELDDTPYSFSTYRRHSRAGDEPGNTKLAEGTSSKLQDAKRVWLEARDQMLQASQHLAEIGLHKQLCNRLIEPWMGITVIISSTEWDNVFRLRDHDDAQPECRAAVVAIRRARDASTPQPLEAGNWHLPLIFAEDLKAPAPDGTVTYHDLIPLSVARCARVSYLTHEGKRDHKADLELYLRLTKSGHWSPFEHVAAAMPTATRVGNFIGWMQHRAEVDPHFIT